jgi:chromosome segregation ATPase
LIELNNYKEKALDHENLMEKVKLYEKKIECLEEKISKLKQSHVQNNEVLDDLQKKYDSQLSQLSYFNEQLDTLQAKDHLQQRELIRLRTIEKDFHYYRTLSATKENEILNLIVEKTKIKYELLYTIISSNHNECDALSKQLELIETNAVNIQANIKNREQDYYKLTELQAIKAKNGQEIVELTEKYVQLKGLHKRMEASLNELKLKHENLNETVTNLKKSNEELITKHQNQLKDLTDQHQHELSLFEAEAQQKNGIIQELEGRLHAKITENAIVRDSLDKKEEEIKRLTSGHQNQLKDLAVQHQHELSLFEAELQQKNVIIQDLESRLHAKNTENDTIITIDSDKNVLSCHSIVKRKVSYFKEKHSFKEILF